MSDIESTDWSETAANNIQPSPAGWPPNSSPNIVYTTSREGMGAIKRDWNRRNAAVTSGGSGNAQTLTYTSTPVGYIRGQHYGFIAGATNSGPTTLNVNGAGAQAIILNGASLVGGELKAGQIAEVIFDGANFQLVGGSVYLSGSGGTISGSQLIIAPAPGASPQLILNRGNSTVANFIVGQTGSSNRWYIEPGYGAESGGNSGGDLGILRCDDTGATIDTPFNIVRSTGAVGIANSVTHAVLSLNKPAGAFGNWIYGNRAGLNRWTLQLGDATAEGGGNSGSHVYLSRYTDAGGLIDNPIAVNRTTATTTFSVAIVNGPSDRSLKENITPLDGALDKVKALQGVSFNMKATPEKREIGLIAQDVEPVIPEVIQQFNPGPDAEGKQAESKLALDYPRLVAVLIEAVKELSGRIEKLEARLPLAPETA